MNEEPTPEITQLSEPAKNTEGLRAEELRRVAIYGTGKPLTGILAKIVQDTINMGDSVNDNAALDQAKKDFTKTALETKAHHERTMKKYGPSDEAPEIVEAFQRQHRAWLVGRFTAIGVPAATATEIVETQILEEKK